MITPPAGTSILVLFPGAAGPAYQAGGNEPGCPVDMLPVILPDGHRIDLPGVEGVLVLPWDWASKVAEAVMEYARLWDPSPDVPGCEDCQTAGGLMCAAHRDQQARSDEFRQLVGWLADIGIEPPPVGLPDAPSPGLYPEDTGP